MKIVLSVLNFYIFLLRVIGNWKLSKEIDTSTSRIKFRPIFFRLTSVYDKSNSNAILEQTNTMLCTFTILINQGQHAE